MQQAVAPNQQPAACDAGQAEQAVAVQAFTQQGNRQQTGPQSQGARHQHRAMRCRREKETAVGQHRVKQAAKHAAQHRDAPRQRGKTEQRSRVRLANAQTPHPEIAPGQHHHAGPHDTHAGDIQRQQITFG